MYLKSAGHSGKQYRPWQECGISSGLGLHCLHWPVCPNRVITVAPKKICSNNLPTIKDKPISDRIIINNLALTHCMLGNFACFFVVYGLFFFKLTFSKKNLAGIPSECQTVWIQISPNVLLGLIWVQTVCKGYEQTTKVTTSQ